MMIGKVICHRDVVGIIETVIPSRDGNHYTYRYFNDEEKTHLIRICFAWDDYKIVD